ncbi:rubisco accumulation factor 1, chloroplastic-like [Phragmites australis]|uniref:rubisco accumulation factor 1, chloroplastic-like n=1 Tax=Phragmites australis TaxID=29695 RepID=UPI002D783EAE|nr:rubisco accumulation factor 1, chloroplastic-like [Phragmites australis]XP_062200423.1 rubisco accumulation factor 1, chloroplastic-like [Phragmites australis]XP_062200424.1 rubisco accumulation factor 1, chloroplastic-like [Phragmites australis]XP_062200425.1 rubisco accumulation factor 1, chloroplastic-like [Phragmites australis]XP_062200427.1 rubisco accumulation factor 1, chloroplastic-like [Phragmites australis]XP_062200428.1 rubisco accumulation factor 1, chloroplastic-like [Phragmite
MLSLSHPHPHPSAASTAPRHRTPRSAATPASRRRRARHIAATAIILPGGGGGGGGPSDRKLPFTPPPMAPPGQLYQPFHPPPSPLPANYRNLDLRQRLEVLRDRMGQWHEYAPLISALTRDGFTPSSIEEATGISGVEQNSLVVAAQVRDSLLDEKAFPADLVPFFDHYGAPEVLYELRFLNARQRADAAKHAIDNRLDPKGVRELARSMKDFPRRRGDDGWETFTGASPADCLAYARFRQSREAIDVEDQIAELERALQVVETEAARARVEVEMERAKKKAAGEAVEDAEDDPSARPAVTVVRLQYGEVAEASTVLLLPVVRETDGVAAVDAAPRRSKTDVDLGIVEVDKGWARWAVVPGWGPVAEAADEAVVIELADGRVLPWRSAEEEKVLVIADRRRKEVVEEGLYVLDKEGRLVVEKGRNLVERGVGTAVAEVVMVVRPPKEVDDMISDDEWD